MNVKELIEKLTEYPEDMDIVVLSYCYEQHFYEEEVEVKKVICYHDDNEKEAILIKEKD